MTTPVNKSTKKKTVTILDEMGSDHYVLEIVDKFIQLGGAQTIAIPYNISLEQLKMIMPQINGFYIPGGNLPDGSEQDKVN